MNVTAPSTDAVIQGMTSRGFSSISVTISPEALTVQPDSSVASKGGDDQNPVIQPPTPPGPNDVVNLYAVQKYYMGLFNFWFLGSILPAIAIFIIGPATADIKNGQVHIPAWFYVLYVLMSFPYLTLMAFMQYKLAESLHRNRWLWFGLSFAWILPFGGLISLVTLAIAGANAKKTFEAAGLKCGLFGARGACDYEANRRGISTDTVRNEIRYYNKDCDATALIIAASASLLGLVAYVIIWALL